MPRISIVAKKYAQAIFTIAKKQSKISLIESEINKFCQSLNRSFVVELNNPAISKLDIEKIITQFSAPMNFSRLTNDFIITVARNKRISLFPEIYQQFCNLKNINDNIITAKLITLQQLDENQINKIRSIIELKYPSKKIVISQTINNDIAGGLQIRIGSQIIDASLKNEIEQISNALLKTINS